MFIECIDNIVTTAPLDDDDDDAHCVGLEKATLALQVGFSEDDQVALYNMNKEQERCGRQGLGVRGMPPKVCVVIPFFSSKVRTLCPGCGGAVEGHQDKTG